MTNTLVSLGSARRSDEFRRAFTTATVHDFFNVFAVAILLPVELLTGVLSNAAGCRFEALNQRCEQLQASHQSKIVGYLHSDEPGRAVVPRAIHSRYLNRIVANLVGIVRTASEPVALEPSSSVSDLDE